MIREDYILSWIRRFLEMLAQIIGLVKADQYEAAIKAIDGALQTLLDLGPDSITTLSEGQIMARLTLGEPTQVVQAKCVMLAAVLQQLGIVCAAQRRTEESRDCLIKALHIMLGVSLGQEANPLPDYAPKLEDLTNQLKGQELPARTYAALMHYYEQAGAYGKAEDALFALRDSGFEPAREIGVAFYERLLAQSDSTLSAGNLPRPEVEAGLAELSGKSRQEDPFPG